MHDQNVFQRACLIQLSTSCWQGHMMLHATIMEKIGDSDWIRGVKNLVNPESLAFVRSAISKARTQLKKSALPFPIKSLTLVPKESLSRIDRMLNEAKDEFYSEVEIFLRKYDDEQLIARRNLGELFSEADYPIDIRSKFKFEWRFLTLDIPGRSKILPPEVYEREKTKFIEMMEETRELAVTALREEFSEIISHLTDRLSGMEDGKPKRFKNSMVERLREFLRSFGDRNLFEDEKLAELVDHAKEIVDGISADELRKNQRLRDQVAEEMTRLKTVIDETMEDLPRRKIRLAA